MLAGLSTGFHDLDKMTHGLMEANGCGSRPTQYGQNISCHEYAERIALIQNEPVGVFSLEMTAESLILRTLLPSQDQFESRSRWFLLREIFPGSLRQRRKWLKPPCLSTIPLAFPFSSSEPELAEWPNNTDQTLCH